MKTLRILREIDEVELFATHFDLTLEIFEKTKNKYVRVVAER